jgi:hypothetical protein
MMCSLVSVLALSGVLAPAQDTNPRAAAPAYPQPGSDIPGPFSPYNVNGRKKDHFHCLVCQHGLNPVVMVVVRGVEDKDGGLKALLGKLDNMVDKNPNTRLASFAVFLSDTLKDTARDDNQREKLVQKMEGLFPPGGYQHMVLALDTPARLARWKLAADADVTIVLYNKYRTVAVHGLTWDQLKPGEGGALPPKVKEVLSEVGEKFGATR